MNNIISGKEALIALANGQDVQYMNTSNTFKFLGWSNAFGLETNLFFSDRFKFRLKSKTISINGIEVPCCGENYQDGDVICILNSLKPEGYSMVVMDEPLPYWWRTEDEIKQVVSALKTIFKTN